MRKFCIDFAPVAYHHSSALSVCIVTIPFSSIYLELLSLRRTSDGKKMPRILVIDDDEPIRIALRKMLESEGHEVVEASDGARGLRLFDEQPADLVIADILMPEKEGFEVIRELLVKKPDVKIIAMSGDLGQI